MNDMKLQIDDRMMPLHPVRKHADDKCVDSKTKSDNTDPPLGILRPGRPPFKEETMAKHRKRDEQEALLTQFADHLNDRRFT